MKLWILTLLFFTPLAEANMNPLKECPESPNCVYTQSSQADKKMDPLPFSVSAEDMLERIKKVVLGMDRARLEKQEGLYLHFTFKSRIFGFVDDVEFVVDPANSLVHFRSASRTGHSDLGVNKKRMQKISKALMKGQ